jgi:FkbM family methyltransferase
VPRPAASPRPAGWFRFRPGRSWLEHLWKSTLRQDHAALAPLLRPLLPPEGVAIDVGAHGGQVTRLLSALVPRGQVVAVEPSSYARSVLRLALLLRGRRNVAVVAAALGAAPGVAVLATPLKRAGAMGYGAASLAPDAARPAVREAVAVVTLDALVAAMALPRVDLLKIDVEGWEEAVLAGAAETLVRHRPALYLEVARQRLERAGSAPEALWRRLEALGYRAEAVPAPRPPMADGDWLFRHAAG